MTQQLLCADIMILSQYSLRWKFSLVTNTLCVRHIVWQRTLTQSLSFIVEMQELSHLFEKHKYFLHNNCTLAAKMATSTAVRKIIVTQRTVATIIIDQCWITTLISVTKISAIKIIIGPWWIFTPADWPAPFRSSTAPMSGERSEFD